MKKLIILFFLFSTAFAQQPMYYNLAAGKYVVFGLSSDTKPVSPPDNCYFIEANTGKCFVSVSSSWNEVSIGITQAAFDAKATNVGLNGGTTGQYLKKNSNTNYDWVWGTIAGGGDLLAANNLSDLNNAGTARNNLSLGNLDNTSDANKPVSTAQATAITARGYTLSVQALTSSPADGATIYFGQLPKAPTTTAAISKVYIRKAGTIKAANIFSFSGTAGTNEAWVAHIRLNNTTDTQIASVSLATGERVWSNTGLSIAVVVGDYIEIKLVNPTWGTNPLTTIFGGYIYIE